MAQISNTQTNSIFSPNVDDLLFDVVTAIELSDHDRQIAENRYKTLKDWLEKPSSPFAELLKQPTSHIYVQGSMAISAVVVSGIKEDRFDLDALVEVKVPSHWNNDKALDLLFEALQKFPGARKIVRCTRCVQLQFSSMHMDVTIMDPTSEPHIEHAGEIFHSPDTGASLRIPASPYNFSAWFRSTVKVGSQQLVEKINARRQMGVFNRFYAEDAEIAYMAIQHDIPEMIPPRLDSEQVLALKLLKRFLNLRYEDRDVKRPPSIYLSKIAATVALSPAGITSQLLLLAETLNQEMQKNLNAHSKPDERNPPYPKDKLNDRWPSDMYDMQTFSKDLEYLIKSLFSIQGADFSKIVKIFTDLFGERISQKSVQNYTERLGKESGGGDKYVRGSGIYIPASTIVPSGLVKETSSITPHKFHCDWRGKD